MCIRNKDKRNKNCNGTCYRKPSNLIKNTGYSNFYSSWIASINFQKTEVHCNETVNRRAHFCGKYVNILKKSLNLHILDCDYKFIWYPLLSKHLVFAKNFVMLSHFLPNKVQLLHFNCWIFTFIKILTVNPCLVRV